MEEIKKKETKKRVRAVLFDFDGTLSTLRCGWERVMEPLMLELIGGGNVSDELRAQVSAYIDESTGIQTIYQMKWLAEQVRSHGGQPLDPWDYKAEYNRRLMLSVSQKKRDVQMGKTRRQDYLIKGSEAFLRALKADGVKIFVASGTDHPDVLEEARTLGLLPYFDEIAGAPPHAESCSKEAVLRRLAQEHELSGGEVAVIGDGKVEIALGAAIGARTLGLATDEVCRCGVNPVKRERLIKAGADCVTGDFSDLNGLLNWLNLDSPQPERYPSLSFDKIKTNSAHDRVNLVRIDTLRTPGRDSIEPWGNADFETLLDHIVEARINGRPVIWSQGAHVIKNGLSRYLISLMRSGIITHISGNGACSIHDFELAYLGGTSENVPTAIEDGSFGMWEETGRWMNEAIQLGAKNGWGYGEALARYIDAHQERFPYRDDCVLYQAYLLGIPATYHIALGTDIIHQHPIVDFAAIGQTSGTDFHRMCASVSQLDGGVFLNFGSGVIGPEVFLKALSIARNLGYATYRITTANFDLIDLGDYREKIGYDDPNYYYRPRKNIVNRPVSRGGVGWHFVGDHQATIPNLYEGLRRRGWIMR